MGNANYDDKASLALIGTVPDEFRNVNLVPEHSLPKALETFMAAAFSTFGGAFLGLALSALTQGGSDSDVIRPLAEACVKDPKICAKLAQIGSVSAPFLWLAIGIVFLAIYFISIFASLNRPKNSAGQGAAQTVGNKKNRQ